MNYQNSQKKDINNIEDKCVFKKIRNAYFLRKAFNYLQKKNSLEIIKYNKKIKERLNININDYKEYCETYSSIEIELKPVNNKFGEFINIKEEIKRKYLDEKDKVNKINIIIDYQIKSFYGLFGHCRCIESIYFKKCYRNNINDMTGMFIGCSSLKEINLSNFNTNNVISMQGMFSGCSSSKEINLSNFNNNNATNMSLMLFGCSSLKKINLSNFNTNNVTDIIRMFSGCSDEIKMKIREQIKNIKEEAFV